MNTLYLQQAAPQGTFRYYSMLFACPENKEVLQNLYALHDALQQPLQCTEPVVALNKWHWWQQEIYRLFKQQAQHPVTQGLQQLTHWHKVKEAPLIKAAERIRSLLNTPYCLDEDSFYAYCDEYYGGIVLLFFQYGGWQDNSALHCAQVLGKILGISNSIMTARQQIAANRCILSLHNCPDEKNFLQGNMTHELKHWLHQWVVIAEEQFRDLKKTIYDYPQYKALWQPFFFLALLHKIWLDKAEKENFPIFQKDVVITPLRQLWTVLKNAG